MKQVSSLLQERDIDLGSHYWANGQYSKREFASMAGLPAGMNLTNLSAKIIQIFSIIFLVNETKTFLSIFPGVMILFDKQNLQMSVIEEVLKYLKMQRFLQIFLLCLYCKMLWSKSKMLHSFGRIHNRNKAT